VSKHGAEDGDRQGTADLAAGVEQRVDNAKPMRSCVLPFMVAGRPVQSPSRC
jgi:hypothetical protein